MRKINCLIYGLGFLPAISLAQSTDFQQQLQQSAVLSKELNQNTPHLAKPAGEMFNSNLSNVPQQAGDLHFELKEIEVKILSEQGLDTPINEDLSTLISPYLNRPITLADLNELTRQITLYYRQHNYLVARAYLPQQTIENQRVIIGLMLGNVGEVRIDNQSRFKTNFDQRMANTSVNSQPYLAQSEVEKLSLLLNEVPGINAQLGIQAGQNRGSADVNIQLKDSKLWQGYFFTDNQGTSETGKYRLSAGIKMLNLAGMGDQFNLDLLSSQNARLKNIRAEYSWIIDGYGTRFGVFGSYLHYKLGKNFTALDAKGNNQTLGAYILHPTIRQPNFHLNTKLTFSHSRIRDAQGIPQPIENIAKINLINLSFNGVWNSFARGTTYFNLGATVGRENNHSTEAWQNSPIDWQASNKFTLVNAEIAHEQMLPKDFAIEASIKGQMADRNISSNQKMLLGGTNGVRGYRTGVASISDGILSQINLKHYQPLLQDSLLVSSLFYDFSAGKKYHKIQAYEQRPEQHNHIKLQSVGAGLQLFSPNNYSLSFYYAKPIGARLEKEKEHQIGLSLLKLF
ncbi:ShlB/FhaC/HecB family hemolysin secretion/activation protein [Avibacterium endocarditidis]